MLTNQPDLDAGVNIVLMTIGSVEQGAVDVWRCDALEAAFWEALSELPMHEFLHDVDENEVCAPNIILHRDHASLTTPLTALHLQVLHELTSVGQLLRLARREEAAVWESAPPGGYTAALRDAVRRIVDVDGGAQLDSAHSADSQTRSAGRSRVQTPD